jgi:hypothetical protein
MSQFHAFDPDDAARPACPIPSGDDLPPMVLLLRIHAAAGKVHSLGRRASAEAFAQLACGPAGPAAVLQVLADFARLTPEQITAAGADRPMPRPLGVVQ